MRTATATLLVTLSALLSGMPAAEAETKAEAKLELRYERNAATRRAVSRSGGRDRLPDGLRSREDGSHRRNGGPHRSPDGHSDQHPAEGDRREAEIVERASAAARWVWEHHLYERGRAEYFEIGFYKGLRRASRHPGLGDWDFQAGRDRGHHDHDARGEGWSAFSMSSVSL